ncbi:MAG: sterol-binding protein [Proteobacteria bacterium]|nr:sterol-binding protein [Pseudomonadota bacterium]
MAGAVPEPVRNFMRALPTQPPSFALARVLDRVLLPRLDAEMRLALSGRAVHVELQDLGLRLRLQLNVRGFGLAPSHSTPTVTIRSTSAALWRLARGVEDADRLFFERALVMEGDTEFGLLLKNTLDAIGPLWK